MHRFALSVQDAGQGPTDGRKKRDGDQDPWHFSIHREVFGRTFGQDLDSDQVIGLGAGWNLVRTIQGDSSRHRWHSYCERTLVDLVRETRTGGGSETS
jgi:hypothetical protein